MTFGQSDLLGVVIGCLVVAVAVGVPTILSIRAMRAIFRTEIERQRRLLREQRDAE